MTTFEKVENKGEYKDRRIPLLRRYTTCPEHTLLTTNVVIRSNLLRSMFIKWIDLLVKKICFFFNNILEVKFLNLAFKVDQDKRIYFLYCRRMSTFIPSLKEIRMFSSGDFGRYKEHRAKDFVMNAENLVKEKHKETDSENEVVCVSCEKFSGRMC